MRLLPVFLPLDLCFATDMVQTQTGYAGLKTQQKIDTEPMLMYRRRCITLVQYLGIAGKAQ